MSAQGGVGVCKLCTVLKSCLVSLCFGRFRNLTNCLLCYLALLTKPSLQGMSTILIRFNQFQFLQTMKFETYKKIVDYSRAVLTGDRKPLSDLTNPQQKAFKRKAASFTLTDNTLYRKGKIVLHEMNTLPTLLHITTTLTTTLNPKLNQLFTLLLSSIDKTKFTTYVHY